MTATTLDLPTLNRELLEDLVTWAGQDYLHLSEWFESRGFPQWDQNVWARQVINGHCDTFCCIAGNAVLQSPGWGIGFKGRDMTCEAYPTVEMTGKDGRPVEVLDTTVMPEYISDVARQVLGLTYSESAALFDGENTLADIVFLATSIAQDRGLTLDLNGLDGIVEDESRWVRFEEAVYVTKDPEDD